MSLSSSAAVFSTMICPRRSKLLGRRAVLVVGRRLHHEGHATRAVAFVRHILVAHARQFAGALFHGAIDVVGRHVGLARLEQERAQAHVALRVAAARLGRLRDVAGEPAEHLALACIGDGFETFDFGPLVMTGHGANLG